MKITLKGARVNAGLTQEQAAAEFRVSKKTVANWEKGFTFPDAVQIKEIERAYKVKYDDLNFFTS